MTLSELIQRRKHVGLATAIPATPATNTLENRETVAKIATVAVANLENEKLLTYATQMQKAPNSSEITQQLIINIGHVSKMDFFRNALPPILKPYCGGSCVVIVAFQHEAGKAKLQLGGAWKVTPNNTLVAQLKELCGGTCVTIESTMSPGDSIDSAIEKELIPLIPSLIKIHGGTEEEWIESAVDSFNETNTINAIKECWTNLIKGNQSVLNREYQEGLSV